MTTRILTLATVLFLAVLAVTPSFAGEGGKVCYLPRDCVEVLDSEFSTGGGKSAVWYVEVRCRLANGRQRIYIDGDWGFRLLGRFELPKYIDLVPSNVPYLDCQL